MIGVESVPGIAAYPDNYLAAIASPIGGVIALWAKPSTLFMSAVLGFTSGILLATIAFEMLPNALEHSSLDPTDHACRAQREVTLQ
jgi:zinc transporter ZupT